jgi:hypothetical protein
MASAICLPYLPLMKTVRFATWLLSGWCTLASTSCHKTSVEPTEELVLVSYAQTQCADRWGQANSVQKLQTVATAYLAQQGITGHALQASVQGSAAVCNACTCPTGLVLAGSVRKADLPALLALGFTKL